MAPAPHTRGEARSSVTHTHTHWFMITVVTTKSEVKVLSLSEISIARIVTNANIVYSVLTRSVDDGFSLYLTHVE